MLNSPNQSRPGIFVTNRSTYLIPPFFVCRWWFIWSLSQLILRNAANLLQWRVNRTNAACNWNLTASFSFPSTQQLTLRSRFGDMSQKANAQITDADQVGAEAEASNSQTSVAKLSPSTLAKRPPPPTTNFQQIRVKSEMAWKARRTWTRHEPQKDNKKVIFFIYFKSNGRVLRQMVASSIPKATFMPSWSWTGTLRERLRL